MSTEEPSMAEPRPDEPGYAAATAEPGPDEPGYAAATAEPGPDEPGYAAATAEPGPDEPGYAAAMAELEQILDELEGEDPDVDVLATRVERAATLIEVCRRRIANASVQVERVVAGLESEDGQ